MMWIFFPSPIDSGEFVNPVNGSVGVHTLGAELPNPSLVNDMVVEARGPLPLVNLLLAVSSSLFFPLVI